MASVKFELRNEGKGLHEWDYMPLSEARVVRLQIQNRAKLDKSYEMKQYSVNPFASQGAVPMSEPITVTYLDLDRLIDECGLDTYERYVVDRLMEGYNRQDVADMKKREIEEITQQFDTAVDKIVERNQLEWSNSHGKYRIHTKS